MIEYFLAGVKVGLFALEFAVFAMAVIISLVILMVITEAITKGLSEIKWQANNYRKYGRRK